MLAHQKRDDCSLYLAVTRICQALSTVTVAVVVDWGNNDIQNILGHWWWALPASLSAAGWCYEALRVKNKARKKVRRGRKEVA
jgi:cyanate permease